jgi:tRNA-specific 2-thiouridylase
MKNSKQKTKNKKIIVVGLSGGVDSSVAALILKKKGYRVIGAFMKNFSDTKNPYTGECSYVEDKKMAQRMAIHLNIDFVVFDFEKEYKKYVIKKMYEDYRKGLTPNPDTLCNTIIKFPLFWKEAKKLGADYIAMGHYAKIKNKENRYQLHRGKDKNKDQSYFLSNLNQKDLSHTLFPIGNLTKSEVREIAKKNKFPNWSRTGTRGICFVGKVNMQSFLKKKIKTKIGKVFDENKDEIGIHQGISFYTIGQKALPSIGIYIKKPTKDAQKRFYIAKKIKPNKLIVAPEGQDILKTKIIKIKSLKKINKNEEINNKIFKARIRHLGKLHKGRLIDNQFELFTPIESVAPGQILVLYDKSRVVASGIIN